MYGLLNVFQKVYWSNRQYAKKKTEKQSLKETKIKKNLRRKETISCYTLAAKCYMKIWSES